jgi:hypothetical protein
VSTIAWLNAASLAVAAVAVDEDSAAVTSRDVLAARVLVPALATAVGRVSDFLLGDGALVRGRRVAAFIDTLGEQQTVSWKNFQKEQSNHTCCVRLAVAGG